MIRRFGRLAAAAVLAGGLAIGFASGSGTAATSTSPTSFAFTGGTQSFMVPGGVTQLSLDGFGAAGGAGGGCTNEDGQLCGDPGSGGLGAHVTSSVAVTPGETLTIVVGGHGRDGETLVETPESFCDPAESFPLGGAGGFGGGAGGGDGGCPAAAGGGGGGSTMVMRGTTPILVAAGGGGGSGAGLSDGPAIDGADGGNSGAPGATNPGDVQCLGQGGGAGTTTAGGTAGAGGTGCTSESPANASATGSQFGATQECGGAGADGVDGAAGTAAAGGAGGDGGIDETVMGAGGGGGAGGLFGGGGGGGGGSNCTFIASAGGGGGGGSSLGATVLEGVRTGDGALTITFTAAGSGTAQAPQVVTVTPRFTG